MDPPTSALASPLVRIHRSMYTHTVEIDRMYTHTA